MSYRLEYQPDNIFAKMLRGEIPCHKVFEDDVALAFMDIMPRGDGHTLIIPKMAVRGLLDMPAEALGPFMERVQRVSRAVVKGMDAEGLTLQQFNETAGGQVVFHLHFHVLPRWEGIRLRPHTGEMEKPDVLRQNAERIRAAL
ncbi:MULTISPECIES: HIT family protein [unclassified Beijerinckia]|uniref:HIT family protein n=1 Tax=unclassified Beijerinckia TaxID=2638183 RepID=UPI0008954CEA|nr:MULTISPECIES: HIT family protein [unclassified Beijerinckia]MDH7794523.1 histidine triad (HIT) family protein [Beijerinckia sp. GAS462]SEB65278.1 histidine triad (HIT) family protein [Beijerinckia sp. 28-YEA-48]